MTTLLTPIPKPRSQPTTTPRPRKWTCQQFHMLGDMGVFEGVRPMLIDGEILEQGPMNSPHAKAGIRTEIQMRKFEPLWHLRSQKPLVFGLNIDPLPDVAIVKGSPDDYADHPTTATLIVEISDTSLRFDKTEKMSLYAAASIPEYWVLDLTGRLLFVYRDPVADPDASHGGTYRSVATIPATGTVSPLADPALSFAVADLLD